MGCDGGTIPKRDELVRTKKKKAEAAKDVKIAAKWNNCHLSQLPLQKPIVADMLGYLYNKDCFIEYLLDRSKYEGGPDYVKSLKDVKELSLVDNPSYTVSNSDNTDDVINKSKWICPISGLEMNGSFKFYFLYGCGCVFSERAYKQISQSSLKCLKCDREFSENDLFIINPNEEEILINKKKMTARKEMMKSSKSSHKSASSSSVSASTSSSKSSLKEETSKDSSKKSSSSNDNHHKEKRKQDLAANDGLINQSKKAKSIQEDPNCSDVYKSIFNTCEKAKNQQKAHWVTFNPQYY